MRWDIHQTRAEALAAWDETDGVAFLPPPRSSRLASFLAEDMNLRGTVRGRKRPSFASFFKDEDLAPEGGLPPPNGWGEGNDSPCKTCACSDQYGPEAAEDMGGGETSQRMVFPNVPHHSFYPHHRGYKLSQFKVFALFFAGLGCGYAGANLLTRKEQPIELGRNEELAGSRPAQA
mmetsp:Transcript_57688/g.108104  ORF Transcript_57688/g.108104 Transcript_57688/m.108104 type:complete len:176 (+) Transcript_57688:31-558(+)